MITRLILASSSPYRQEILKKLGLPFEAIPPAISEIPRDREPPDALALRLATEKAWAVAHRHADSLVIGSDQVAWLDGKQLTKPMDRRNAIHQLRGARGRTVEFYTALCVANSTTGETKSDLDLCKVTFRCLSEEQIARYVDRDRPFDCAGGFKAEGLGIVLFERIEGEDPNALIGLPLIRLVRLLEAFGVGVL